MQLGSPGGLICSGSGTLGVLVKYQDARDMDIYLLSCSHVIANGGQFTGSFSDLPDFVKVVQQPVSSPCDPTVDRVGILQDGFSVFGGQPDGTTDADIALAKLDPDVAAATSNIQAATGNSIADFAQEPPDSWDSGVTTQLLGAMSPGAAGHIIGYNGLRAEPIDLDTLGMVKMTGLVRYYSERAEKGDSGAAVVDGLNRLLGIHVAGSTNGGNIALFCPVGAYLIQKGLVLV